MNDSVYESLVRIREIGAAITALQTESKELRKGLLDYHTGMPKRNDDDETAIVVMGGESIAELTLWRQTSEDEPSDLTVTFQDACIARPGTEV